jgi:hypothetical protein
VKLGGAYRQKLRGLELSLCLRESRRVGGREEGEREGGRGREGGREGVLRVSFSGNLGKLRE